MPEDPDTIICATTFDWEGDVGIRINAQRAARMGIKPGQELVLKVLGERDRIDISHLSSFSDGRGADEHDAFLAEARLEELERHRK